MRKANILSLLFSLLLTLSALACQTAPSLTPAPETRVLPTAAQPIVEAEAPTPTATSKPPHYVYQPNPEMPPAFNQLLEQQALHTAQGAANELTYTFAFGDADPVGEWIYALVAPFPTVRDEVSADWLRKLWQGQPEDAVQTLLIAEEDLPALSSLLGEPGQSVRTQLGESLLETAWTTQNTWAIIPFGEIKRAGR